MSIKTDAAYALKQLRGAHLTHAHSVVLHDRVQRAIDALERIAEAAPDEVCHCGLGPEDHYHGGPAEHNYVPKGEGDPAGTPAVTDLSCRVVPMKDAWRGAEWMLDSMPGEVGEDVPIALVDSHSTCGPAGRQTFPAVAVAFDLDSPNPGVLFRCPTTLGLTEKIVAFLKTRPWEEGT